MRLQEYLCFALDIAVFVAKICQSYYHGVKTFVNSLSVPMGIFSTFFLQTHWIVKHLLTFFAQRRHFSEIQRFLERPRNAMQIAIEASSARFFPGHFFSSILGEHWIGNWKERMQELWLGGDVSISLFFFCVKVFTTSLKQGSRILKQSGDLSYSRSLFCVKVFTVDLLESHKAYVDFVRTLFIT